MKLKATKKIKGETKSETSTLTLSGVSFSDWGDGDCTADFKSEDGMVSRLTIKLPDEAKTQIAGLALAALDRVISEK